MTPKCCSASVQDVVTKSVPIVTENLSVPSPIFQYAEPKEEDEGRVSTCYVVFRNVDQLRKSNQVDDADAV